MAKELLLLMGSIVSSTVVSFFLSLSLSIRRLRRQGEGKEEEGTIHLYEGRVSHLRTLPVRHAFHYPVRYALLDLDLHDASHHLSASQARRLTASDGPVLLLTIPESVGYEQNPLSIYYCFHPNPDGRLFLKACIAEVTNTPWGERVNFVFSPGSDLVAKPLHVSPFMDMMGNWRIHTEEPGDKLSVVVSVHHPQLGNYFTATLKAKRVSRSSSPTMVASFFWLMPHKVALWIYWHALKLWWKGVSFVGHPKYLNPTYREDARKRDRELHHSNHQLQGEDYSTCMNNMNNEDRCCIWKDAQWPWA